MAEGPDGPAVTTLAQLQAVVALHGWRVRAPGIDGDAGIECYVVDRDDEGWFVGYRERGTTDVIARFATVDEAAADVFVRLREQHTRPAPRLRRLTDLSVSPRTRTWSVPQAAVAARRGFVGALLDEQVWVTDVRADGRVALWTASPALGEGLGWRGDEVDGWNGIVPAADLEHVRPPAMSSPLRRRTPSHDRPPSDGPVRDLALVRGSGRHVVWQGREVRLERYDDQAAVLRFPAVEWVELEGQPGVAMREPCLAVVPWGQVTDVFRLDVMAVFEWASVRVERRVGDTVWLSAIARPAVEDGWSGEQYNGWHREAPLAALTDVTETRTPLDPPGWTRPV